VHGPDFTVQNNMTSSASFKEVVINDPSAKDGLTFLVADHENIIKLMDQSRDAGTLLQKKNYCDDLIRSISRNASIQEQHCYPLVRDILGDVIADRCLKEDQSILEMLSQLETMLKQKDLDVPMFNFTVDAIVLREKESLRFLDESVFPKIREFTSWETLEQLYNNLQFSYHIAPTHPHKMLSIRPETGANLIHPIIGVVDRVIDNLSGRKLEEN
jgi:hypothetical protein